MINNITLLPGEFFHLTPVGAYVYVKSLSRRVLSPDRAGFTPQQSNNATVLTDGQILFIIALLKPRVRGRHGA